MFKKKDPEKSEGLDVQAVVQNPLPPEEAEGLLKEVGGNWFYGQGLGETALTVGTIVAFPPYALWVVGNAALSVSGYEPLRVSDALPDEEGEAWRSTYDSITSGPGRLTAAVAGKEFRTKEVAQDNIKVYLEKAGQKAPSAGNAEAQALNSQTRNDDHNDRPSTQTPD